MDEAMSFLLPTLVLLVASTAALLATRAWKARKRLGSRAGGSGRGRAAPGAEESPEQGPAAAGSAPPMPCGCGPGCGPCAAAARELQELLAPLRPGPAFPRDAETWRLLWEDLEQLLERGHLPCCASSSSSRRPRGRSRSRRQRRSLIHGKTSAAGKGSVLHRIQRSLRSSTLPRMPIPRKGSSIAIHTQCDPCGAPTGTWPLPAKKQVSWSRRCPIHGSQDPEAEPSGQTLRMLLYKRLQRQRQLVPPSGCSLELAVKDKDKQDLLGDTWDINSQDLHPCQSLHEVCWTPDGGAHTDISSCCLGAMATHRTQQIPTARKSLEIHLGARVIPARHSQQQVSPSHRCSLHGCQASGAVAQEKTLRAVLDRRLRREREQPLFKGALGRWLARLRKQLVEAVDTL